MIWLEIFLLAAFFVGLALGDDGKIRSLIAALGGGFWTWWFWIGVVGFGFIIPLGLKKWVDKSHRATRILLVSGSSLFGVFCLRFFVLYAGQLTVA